MPNNLQAGREPLDDVDRRLVEVLQRRGRLPNNALAEQVDADGTDQTVCAGLPGGDLMLTQNVSAEAEQPETATAPGDAGQEAG